MVAKRSHRVVWLSGCALVVLSCVSSARAATTGAESAQDAPSQALTEVVVTGLRGSASSQAPVQSSLSTIEPQSIVTQHFIDNFVPLSGDYSQTIKFTPSFSFSAPNGTGGSESRYSHAP